MKTDRNINIGRIIKPHGIHGEVKVDILTDDPEYFLDLKNVFLVDETGQNKTMTATIESARFHKGVVLLVLDIIRTAEEAETFRGWLIQVPESQLRELEEDEYYIFYMLGVKVYTTEGALVGEITNVIPGGLQDIYEIRNSETGKVNMVPSRKEFIKSVNIPEKTIIIEPIEGLIEL
jgi:16S rRNA processing protein RimM